MTCTDHDYEWSRVTANSHGLQPGQNSRMWWEYWVWVRQGLLLYVLFNCTFLGIVANKYSCKDLHVYFSYCTKRISARLVFHLLWHDKPRYFVSALYCEVLASIVYSLTKQLYIHYNRTSLSKISMQDEVLTTWRAKTRRAQKYRPIRIAYTAKNAEPAAKILSTCLASISIIWTFNFILIYLNIFAVVARGDSELAEFSLMDLFISFIDSRPTSFISTHDRREATSLNMIL